jgi:pimeloyl-ACP methyl ester carboxylesterase
VAEIVQLEGGRRASYEVVGSGEPVLAFPGGPGLPAAIVRDDAELLADRFASYLIDPHGTGDSTPPAGVREYDHLGTARFYDEVRRALGLDRVSVLGVSFGGTVALTYAARYPEATVRCMAVSAFGLGTETDAAEGGAAEAEMAAMVARHEGAPWYPEARDVWESWTERTLAATDVSEVDEMLSIALPLYFAHPDRPDIAQGIRRFRERIASDLAASQAWEDGLYQTIDVRPELGRIHCPTIVVSGALDVICGPAQAGPIAEAVHGSELVVLPDCGHFPAIEAPAAYRSALLDWAAARSP